MAGAVARGYLDQQKPCLENAYTLLPTLRRLVGKPNGTWDTKLVQRWAGVHCAGVMRCCGVWQASTLVLAEPWHRFLQFVGVCCAPALKALCSTCVGLCRLMHDPRVRMLARVQARLQAIRASTSASMRASASARAIASIIPVVHCRPFTSQQVTPGQVACCGLQPDTLGLVACCGVCRCSVSGALTPALLRSQVTRCHIIYNGP